MATANPILLLILMVLIKTSFIDAMAFDNFHCKVATCREFQYGLKNFPRYQTYIDTCYETVSTLLAIPRRYGKCLDDSTLQVNPACIRALANTIKTCIDQLDDLPDMIARYYCGYTLMTHCAVNVGLDRFRLNFSQRPSMDD